MCDISFRVSVLYSVCCTTGSVYLYKVPRLTSLLQAYAAMMSANLHLEFQEWAEALLAFGRAQYVLCCVRCDIVLCAP